MSILAPKLLPFLTEYSSIYLLTSQSGEIFSDLSKAFQIHSSTLDQSQYVKRLLSGASFLKAGA